MFLGVTSPRCGTPADRPAKFVRSLARRVSQLLPSFLRRMKYAPGPSHLDDVELIGGSTDQAYLVVLAMRSAVRPGKRMWAEVCDNPLQKRDRHVGSLLHLALEAGLNAASIKGFTALVWIQLTMAAPIPCGTGVQGCRAVGHGVVPLRLWPFGHGAGGRRDSSGSLKGSCRTPEMKRPAQWRHSPAL